jgi:putative chitinase
VSPLPGFRLLLITPAKLRAIAPKCDAETWAPALSAAMSEADVTSTIRIAAFLAQVAHESAGLTRFEENLNYSAQGLANTWARFSTSGEKGGPPTEQALALARKPELIANVVYAGRLGNGAPTSGEGWKYRGRGPIQVTGKNNYTACGVALRLDLVAQPELLLVPAHGARSAAWYWDSRKLNALADRGDMVGLTKAINGGTIGLEDRLRYFAKAREALAA